MVALSGAKVAGHGYLWDPPSRNNMWRAGFDSEPNYNDHQLNCGGFEVSPIFINRFSDKMP